MVSSSNSSSGGPSRASKHQHKSTSKDTQSPHNPQPTNSKLCYALPYLNTGWLADWLTGWERGRGEKRGAAPVQWIQRAARTEQLWPTQFLGLVELNWIEWMCGRLAGNWHKGKINETNRPQTSTKQNSRIGNSSQQATSNSSGRCRKISKQLEMAMMKHRFTRNWIHYSVNGRQLKRWRWRRDMAWRGIVACSTTHNCSRHA